MKKHIIAFAKKPAPGMAKTRLGEAIGFEESAGVYARLLYQCLLELVNLDRSEISVELCLASASEMPYFRPAFPEFLISQQVESDLGGRLGYSMKAAFDRGSEAVIVIGTDIPDLNQSIILSAFAALKECDVVIGPCSDGGYYLIGTRRRDASLFQGIDWSSEFVFQQTRALVQDQKLTAAYLPVLADIDTQADFQRWLAGLV